MGAAVGTLLRDGDGDLVRGAQPQHGPHAAVRQPVEGPAGQRRNPGGQGELLRPGVSRNLTLKHLHAGSDQGQMSQRPRNIDLYPAFQHAGLRLEQRIAVEEVGPGTVTGHQ